MPSFIQPPPRSMLIQPNYVSLTIRSSGNCTEDYESLTMSPLKRSDLHLVDNIDDPGHAKGDSFCALRVIHRWYDAAQYNDAVFDFYLEFQVCCRRVFTQLLADCVSNRFVAQIVVER